MRTLLYDPTLDLILDDTHLTLLTRQLAYLTSIPGGIDLDGHHYSWQSRAEWRAMLGWSIHRISRVIRRGVDLGIIIRRQLVDNRRAYRLDADRLRELYAEAHLSLPDWLERIAPEIWDAEDEVEAAIAVDVIASERVSYPQEHALESTHALTPESTHASTPSMTETTSIDHDDDDISHPHFETTETESERIRAASDHRCMSAECTRDALDVDEPIRQCARHWISSMPELLTGWRSAGVAARTYTDDPEQIKDRLADMRRRRHESDVTAENRPPRSISRRCCAFHSSWEPGCRSRRRPTRY